MKQTLAPPITAVLNHLREYQTQCAKAIEALEALEALGHTVTPTVATVAATLTPRALGQLKREVKKRYQRATKGTARTTAKKTPAQAKKPNRKISPQHYRQLMAAKAKYLAMAKEYKRFGGTGHASKAKLEALKAERRNAA